MLSRAALLRTNLLLELTILSLLLQAGPSSLQSAARNPWDIANSTPVATPRQDPKFKPGGLYSGYVRAFAFNDNFWQTEASNEIPAGAVLTGIIEDDLSSVRSLPGDTFALNLPDGFLIYGQQLIPPNSKIIGSVIAATPAKLLANGNPGRLQVSLQALVLPDGFHIPVYGFIDQNPNHAQQAEPKRRYLGFSLADYGQSVSAMFGSFTSGIGFMLNRRNRGLDFKLTKGEVVPIRLTRTLTLPASARLTSQRSAYSSPNALTTLQTNLLKKPQLDGKVIDPF